MKKYTIIKKSNMFSTDNLVQEIEQLITVKNAEGYEIVNVSFGTNVWYIPTAFVTICK
jgi:hypothetical protein